MQQEMKRDMQGDINYQQDNITDQQKTTNRWAIEDMKRDQEEEMKKIQQEYNKK